MFIASARATWSGWAHTNKSNPQHNVIYNSSIRVPDRLGLTVLANNIYSHTNNYIESYCNSHEIT